MLVLVLALGFVLVRVQALVQKAKAEAECVWIVIVFVFVFGSCSWAARTPQSQRPPFDSLKMQCTAMQRVFFDVSLLL